MGSAVSLRLPLAAGAHQVGSTDVLVGAGKEGCFFRLFYPCSSSAAQKTETPWCPDPQYLSGLIGIRGWEGRAAQYGASFVLGNPQIPVTWNGNLLPGTDRKPLIIFSHGLGALRTMYSSLCAELASNGFLVAAIEHRDGSACATYHYSEGDSSTSLQEIWVPFKKVQPPMKEFYLRNYQVHQRASECIRAVRILEDIDKGRQVSNIMDSGFSLDAFKDRIDINRIAVMGHSFGGATALLSLAKDNILRCAVVLDAWMFPLDDTCYPHIQKPILLINTETFQTRESIEKIKRMNSEGADLKYLTVKGCVHQSQTDLAFVTGYLANKIVGPQGTLDPHHCLKIHIAYSLDFLQKHLDLAISVPKIEELREVIQSQVICGFPVIKDSKL
ncbi:platelet-activating factor acetylhydrolase 2, cytoplasmic isoform X1 [Hyla sarda]|uniref:platelet-activating factor acetylhydrolase 2, cytoplasmic isoform X1 n=1 Tax=Hyla sarda TaxID=327740 RepID=UPI0024C27A40|nr:platelet-activating factor acetylhydrolase 2, cytoplasmic isoform X1 [Hyla sarda]